MGIENVTAEGWLWFAAIAIILLNVYNVASTARKNAREEQRKKEEPTIGLNRKIAEQARMLDNDKRRLDDHERQLSDMRNGLMAICTGVQALLEHELHNGNTTEMESASKGIDKWLRERP